MSLLRGPRMQMVDGILYSVLALGEDDAHLLEGVPTPMVLLGERIFHGPTDHVTMRNAEGSKAATQHLLSIGRRRLVALGAHRGEVIGSAGLRLDGYREALEEAGIAYDDALVCEVGGWFRSGGAEGLRTLLLRIGRDLRRRGGLQRLDRARCHEGPAGGRPAHPR